jgi:hypothetical protein
VRESSLKNVLEPVVQQTVHDAPAPCTPENYAKPGGFSNIPDESRKQRFFNAASADLFP